VRLLQAKNLQVPEQATPLGLGEVSVVSLGDTTVTREVLRPGWRWSNDVRPTVGTPLCCAVHEIYVVAGRLHVQVHADDTELELVAGDAVVIPAGHDACVVGDEPCELVDFSPAYSALLAAGQAHRSAALPHPGDASARRRVADRLRAAADAGRLDRRAVEIVLAAAGEAARQSAAGPARLTPRELDVLILIATGASTRQAAGILGMAPKTAATHIERIYAKICVSSRASATRFAIRHGIIDASDGDSLLLLKDRARARAAGASSRQLRSAPRSSSR
jgi:DNA-binding CsgD family transcriptional regulator/uncharacterized protein YjlB